MAVRGCANAGSPGSWYGGKQCIWYCIIPDLPFWLAIDCYYFSFSCSLSCSIVISKSIAFWGVIWYIEWTSSKLGNRLRFATMDHELFNTNDEHLKLWAGTWKFAATINNHLNFLFLQLATMACLCYPLSFVLLPPSMTVLPIGFLSKNLDGLS